MRRKTVLVLSLAACALFLGYTLLWALGAPEAGELKVEARPAESAALLTGRDDPDTLPGELLPGQTVDINTAPVEELRLLPGIGEVLAQAIVDYRQTNGPFDSPEALMEVPGIGKGRFEGLAEKITIGDNA